MMYSIGRGCNGVSYTFLQCGYNRGFTLSGGCMQNSFCRFGKISSRFCNQAFLQYGCKRTFTSFHGDVCWAPPADLGKSHWGLAIMHPCQFEVKWGSITGISQLSWVNLGGVPEIMYNGGRECWPVLVWSKQEMNGQKNPSHWVQG